MSRFFLVFRIGKNALYTLCPASWNSGDSAASFQCSAKLIRSAKCCVFCLFVKLQLSPGHVEGPDKDMIPGYRSSGKIRLASRRCTYYSTSYTPWRWKNTNSRFLRFFVLYVPLFRSLMLTQVYVNKNEWQLPYSHFGTLE